MMDEVAEFEGRLMKDSPAAAAGTGAETIPSAAVKSALTSPRSSLAKKPPAKKQKTPAQARRARERQQEAADAHRQHQQETGAAAAALGSTKKRKKREGGTSSETIVAVPSAEELVLREPQPPLNSTTIAKAVAHLQQQDSRLAGVIAAIGQPTGLLDQIGGDRGVDCGVDRGCFKALAKSIVYQQLSVKVAAIIFKRLTDLCGGDELLTPAKALTLADDDLRHKCGFSYRKASYLKHLASSFVSGELSDTALAKMSDEEAMAAVTRVKGLGEWVREHAQPQHHDLNSRDVFEGLLVVSVGAHVPDVLTRAAGCLSAWRPRYPEGNEASVWNGRCRRASDGGEGTATYGCLQCAGGGVEALQDDRELVYVACGGDQGGRLHLWRVECA